MEIRSYVYLFHPELGAQCLPPGPVPEWAVPLITNPKVIVPGSVVEPEEVPLVAAGEDLGSEPEQEPVTEADPESEPEEVPIPPKGGRGGSASKWAEYALSKGFEVDEDATAAEIRESLEAEGIPTE